MSKTKDTTNVVAGAAVGKDINEARAYRARLTRLYTEACNTGIIATQQDDTFREELGVAVQAPDEDFERLIEQGYAADGRERSLTTTLLAASLTLGRPTQRDAQNRYRLYERAREVFAIGRLVAAVEAREAAGVRAKRPVPGAENGGAK
jgi:hypothetical protein